MKKENNISDIEKNIFKRKIGFLFFIFLILFAVFVLITDIKYSFYEKNIQKEKEEEKICKNNICIYEGPKRNITSYNDIYILKNGDAIFINGYEYYGGDMEEFKRLEIYDKKNNEFIKPKYKMPYYDDYVRFIEKDNNVYFWFYNKDKYGVYNIKEHTAYNLTDDIEIDKVRKLFKDYKFEQKSKNFDYYLKKYSKFKGYRAIKLDEKYTLLYQYSDIEDACGFGTKIHNKFTDEITEGPNLLFHAGTPLFNEKYDEHGAIPLGNNKYLLPQNYLNYYIFPLKSTQILEINEK